MVRRPPALAMAALAACGTAPPPEAVVCGGLSRPSVPSQCGATADFTPINQYRGELGSAQDREDAVALIGGNCTGTLIAALAGPVVVTAGHCVSALGARALVAFNVEAEPDGDPLTTEGVVIERAEDPDYALLQLDRLPAAAPTLLTIRATHVLAIIQHPRGRPKVIAEGNYLTTCQARVVYNDLDTLIGSSGAGVLNQQGYLVAVHTDGDCATDGGGANHGFAAEAIVEASAYLRADDLADR
jgi:hypothetical protein